MSTLFWILPILLVIRILNSYRVKNLTTQTENKVNKFRNELYISAIDGFVPKNHPAFLHIDEMIEYSIPVISRVNIWVYFYKALLQKIFKNKNSVNEKMETELSFEKIQPLNKFFQHYANVSVKYLTRKNLFSLFFVVIILYLSRHLSSKMSFWITSMKANLKKQFLSRTDEFYPC